MLAENLFWTLRILRVGDTYGKSITGVITTSQYPINGCIKSRNLPMSFVSTNMKWLCFGAFTPPFIKVTPTYLQWSAQFFSLAVRYDGQHNCQGYGEMRYEITL